jgi:hypothetical protein
MSIFESLTKLHFPDTFFVEYVDGTREMLYRGDGVTLTRPDDDPDGIGYLFALSPKKHPRNQKQLGRGVGFTELQAIYDKGGNRLWSSDALS